MSNRFLERVNPLTVNVTTNPLTVQDNGTDLGTADTLNIDGGLSVVLAGSTATISANATGIAVYGSYGSTAAPGGVGAQSIPLSTAPTPSTVAKLDTDLGSSAGFSITPVADGHGLVVPQSGVYEVAYSIQLQSNGGQQADIVLWLLYNGAPVAGSSSVVAVAANNRYAFPYFSAFLALNAGDNFAVALTNIGGDAPSITPFAATGTYPATPGAILYCKRIGS